MKSKGKIQFWNWKRPRIEGFPYFPLMCAGVKKTSRRDLCKAQKAKDDTRKNVSICL